MLQIAEVSLIQSVLQSITACILDMPVNTSVHVSVSFTGAYPKLVPYRPPSQLISPPLLLSVVLNILFSLSMQIFGFVVVQEQPWYSKTDIHR